MHIQQQREWKRAQSNKHRRPVVIPSAFLIRHAYSTEFRIMQNIAIVLTKSVNCVIYQAF